MWNWQFRGQSKTPLQLCTFVLKHVRLHGIILDLYAYYLGEGNGTPLQYSCLENPVEGGAWCAAVHGVTKSRTRLSGFPFTFHFNVLEKEMATHSSVLAWRIPGTGEPGGLPTMESHRVGHSWSDLAAACLLSGLISCVLISVLIFPNPLFISPSEHQTTVL